MRSLQGSSREPGREAVHVGVGDSRGGGSTSTARGHGVLEQRPAPGPARPPAAAALKPARRAPLVPGPLAALGLLRLSPCGPLRRLRYPRRPRSPLARCRPGPGSGPALSRVSASREKSPPQASLRLPGSGANGGPPSEAGAPGAVAAAAGPRPALLGARLGRGGGDALAHPCR